MAVYTEELKFVIEDIFGTSIDPEDYEQEYQSVTFNGLEYGRLPVVPDWSKLGLGTYPIFDEGYRDILNGKIVDEYYNREIGTETIDNFILIMRKKMDQIMPYYNKLYLSELIKFDPLATIDITTSSSNTGTESSTSDTTATTNSDTKSGARAVSQELPQTMLSGNGDYATAATDTNTETGVTGNSTNNGKSDSNTTLSSESTSKGFQGVASELLIRYRNSILNIDMMVIRELEECFMLILNNGNSYTNRGWLY